MKAYTYSNGSLTEGILTHYNEEEDRRGIRLGKNEDAPMIFFSKRNSAITEEDPKSGEKKILKGFINYESSEPEVSKPLYEEKEGKRKVLLLVADCLAPNYSEARLVGTSKDGRYKLFTIFVGGKVSVKTRKSSINLRNKNGKGDLVTT